MFDPNEDIEDLYRRAADRFDLESSGPDWDKMSRALDNLPAPAGQGGIFRRLMTGEGRFVPVGITAVVAAAVVVAAVLWVGAPVRTKVAGTAAAKRNSGRALDESAGNAAGFAGKAGAGDAGSEAGLKANNTATLKTTNNAGGPATLKTTTNAGRSLTLGTTSGSTRHMENTGATGIPASSLASFGRTRSSAGGGRLTDEHAAGEHTADRRPADEYAEGGGPATASSPDNRETILDIPLTTNNDLPSSLEQVRISTDRLQLKASLPLLAQGASAGTGPVVSPLRRGGRFSAGVSGTLDLSFVTGQPLSQPGGSGGILAGFQATRRINLETGIYIGHKVYYTSGSHLPRVPIPFGTKLVNATTHASLFEIPLTLRYSIMGNRLGVFYAGAGVTSYLVSSEAYNYAYKSMWSSKEKEAHWNYHGKIPQHVLSAASANIGYLWNVGKTDVLRTEIYGKVPLSGTGRASIPVTSAGLSLSFLHSF